MTDHTSVLPGSMTIRPTRKQAESDPDCFYPLLEALRGPDALPLRKIAELSGDRSLNPEPNILRKIKSRTLSSETRRQVLRHIFDDELLISGGARQHLNEVDDACYFAFLNYFGIDETSQDEARAKFIGTYKFWRYAADHDDECILGRLRCTEDSKSRALRVDVHLKPAGEELVRANWHLSGYLFFVEEMALTLTRRSLSGEARISLYPQFRTNLVGTDINPRSVFTGRQDHVVHMDGMTIGVERGRSFLTPVHLALVDDVDELASLESELDTVTEGDPRLPPRVAKRLRRSGPLRRL